MIVLGLSLSLGFQIMEKGMNCIFPYVVGVFLPIAICSLLYLCRMVGAADIKLFSVIGSFHSISFLLWCMGLSLVFGVVVSLPVLFRKGFLLKRLFYFRQYCYEVLEERKLLPYRSDCEEESVTIPFAIPITLALITAMILERWKIM